jgi:sucrose-6-phosphate hydrolase SacC (GH32 family)
MGWLNDPNGMVYYEGEWHMHFQHFAKGNASGPKSWGNAVSTDLIHWQQLPHAINPYPNVKLPQGGIHAIWSGSAVVDELNALSKQKGDVKTLFAIYTATHADAEKKSSFFQAAAFSIDKGRTWTKINDGKPIIDHQPDGEGGQRDPRIFYYAPGKYYVVIMMVGGKERAVRLWKSTDLMNWEKLCDIPNKAAECIDMYTLPLDGDKNKMRWVIADAGTRYEVGDFDGQKWTGNETTANNTRFDYGDCYYAAQVFNQAPDGRIVHIGWLQSKLYSPFIEAKMPFTQQMSIPAEITLRTTPEGIRMFRNPVKEIEKLYAKTDTFEKLPAKELNAKLTALSPELIDMTLECAPAGNFTLNVRGCKINYDALKKEFNFTNADREAGERESLKKMPQAKQKPVKQNYFRAIPAPAVNNIIKLRVLVDRASLELFVNDGQAAASFVVVPDPKDRSLSITAGESVTIHTLAVHELKSIWQRTTP